MPGERFRRRRFSHGYHVEDVDALLARVEAGMATAEEVQQAGFRSVVTRGYDEQEVDEALDAVVRRLQGGGATGSEPSPTRTWWSRLLSGNP